MFFILYDTANGGGMALVAPPGYATASLYEMIFVFTLNFILSTKLYHTRNFYAYTYYFVTLNINLKKS